MSDRAREQVDEGKARAARMVRAFRANDMLAFEEAMGEMAGDGQAVRGALTGLTWIADQILGKSEPVAADRFLDNLIRRAPSTEPVAYLEDSWRDAIAMVEAVARGDSEGARVLLLHSPNTAVFLGCLVQVLSMLIETCPPNVLANVIAEARKTAPPSL